MKLVRLSPYDPAWPRRYAEEAPRVAAALSEIVVATEHVGSTAVPGLEAKPTIDILVGVGDLASVDEAAAAYGELKRKLVATPRGAEVDAYAAGKAGFIADVLGRAEEPLNE